MYKINAEYETKKLNALHDIEVVADFIYRVGEDRKDKADRMKVIKNFNGSLEYEDMENSILKRNLLLVDSYMPQILANMAAYSYIENINSCKELIHLLGERDPLGYGETAMYEYKVGKFLSICALGMKVDEEWNSSKSVNGDGVIREIGGEILQYHIYERKQLVENVIRHAVMVSKEDGDFENVKPCVNDGDMYAKLNMKIFI